MYFEDCKFLDIFCFKKFKTKKSKVNIVYFLKMDIMVIMVITVIILTCRKRRGGRDFSDGMWNNVFRSSLIRFSVDILTRLNRVA